MKSTTNIKMVDGQIKIEQLFDFSDKHKNALINLVKENIYEYRGKATQEDMDIHTELEVMGLAEDCEDAWHPTWLPTEEGKKIASQLLKEETV